MEVIGKKVVREELRITRAKVERIQYVQEVLGCPECKKDGASVIVEAEMLWSSVFVTLVAKKYRFMQFELDRVFDTR